MVWPWWTFSKHRGPNISTLFRVFIPTITAWVVKFIGSKWV